VKDEKNHAEIRKNAVRKISSKLEGGLLKENLSKIDLIKCINKVEKPPVCNSAREFKDKLKINIKAAIDYNKSNENCVDNEDKSSYRPLETEPCGNMNTRKEKTLNYILQTEESFVIKGIEKKSEMNLEEESPKNNLEEENFKPRNSKLIKKPINMKDLMKDEKEPTDSSYYSTDPSCAPYNSVNEYFEESGDKNKGKNSERFKFRDTTRRSKSK
jgi:hypothetical protein